LAVEALQGRGWRTLVIWECALRGVCRLSSDDLLDQAESFVKGNVKHSDLAGRQPAAQSAA
jgi:G:T-mismatch repair DNA endonuclease (very short patch repair protein)